MRMSPLCLAAWLAATLTAAPQAEIATRDVPVTFKTSVRLVSVPVVVRDRQGRAVGKKKKRGGGGGGGSLPALIRKRPTQPLPGRR